VASLNRINQISPKSERQFCEFIFERALSISDTGHGIDPAIKDRIFDPYFTTKPFGEGSGIRLPIVYSIVRNHKGAISVDSEMGKGTTVNMFFSIIAKLSH